MSFKSETANTLKVPYEYYDEALAFCNTRREEKNLKPITELPAGFGRNTLSCPCANAVPGLKVELLHWQFNDLISSDGHPYRFVRFFDQRAIRDTLTLPVRDSRIANGD